MAQERGSMGRAVGHLFRERQIYHRSEGVVHFIKLSSRTQIVFASLLLAGLIWVAYSSVNVVFKEQIILSKDQQRRDEQAAYRRRLQDQDEAYEEVSALNFIYGREFEVSLQKLKRQHDALRSLVENKSALDDQLQGLTKGLSEAGAPGGRRLKGSNRIMVDPVGREPTPRQSRVTALRRETLESVIDQEVAEGIESNVLTDMRRKTAELSASQVVVMASLEEGITRTIRELQQILDHTGEAGALYRQENENRVRIDALAELMMAAALKDDISRLDTDFSGQGGPYIPVYDTIATDGLEITTYFETAARVQARMDELKVLSETVSRVPIGTPVLKRNRQTSHFGIRSDPFTGHKARHNGLDFVAPRRTPIVATAPGRVVRAGRWSSFGNIVEIDHGNGFRTRYAHLNTVKTRVGRQVKLNDVIGLMGTTGRSTGVHLHYEVLYKGRAVDPEHFIEAGRYVFES